MTTDVDIGKMALAEIGTRSTITSLTDGSEEALYINTFYTIVRDQALRAARWAFAKQTIGLTLWKALPGTPENNTVATAWTPAYPAPPWLYSYDLPTDYVYARSVIAQPDVQTLALPLYPISGSGMAFPRASRGFFEMATDAFNTDGVTPLTTPKRILLTNLQIPLFEYTFRSIDPNIWDETFLMTVVLALAARVAIPLTADKQLAQLKLSEANGLIMEARRQDGNEGLTVIDHTPDWLRIRGVGGAPELFDYWYPYGPMFAAF